MNKQLQKIDETIQWLENNAPEDACVMIMAMAEDSATEPAENNQTADRKVELKTYIEGYDPMISEMLVKKMIAIPLLKQVFTEALNNVNVVPDYIAFDKWREKNKYDSAFDPLDLSEESLKPIEGEVAPYIKQVQDFCLWMNAKPSRNMTVLALADDELNSEKTTFAMGFAPDMTVMLVKEMTDNYGFRSVLESAMFGIDRQASYEEYTAWKDSLKK